MKNRWYACLLLPLFLCSCATYDARISDSEESRGHLYPAVQRNVSYLTDTSLWSPEATGLYGGTGGEGEAMAVGLFYATCGFLWLGDTAVSAAVDTPPSGAPQFAHENEVSDVCRA
jgi:hypothetical protein